MSPTEDGRGDRRPGHGRYAHPEREQRWLIRAVPAAAERMAEILDRYITGTRLRLRRVETDDGVLLKLAQKVRTDPASPELVQLTNIYLSASEYDALAAVLPAGELRKTRYRVTTAGGHAISIDQFHGRLDGLVLAEVELALDSPRLDMPDFAERDVTDDDRLSGGWLATASDPDVASLLNEIGIANRA